MIIPNQITLAAFALLTIGALAGQAECMAAGMACLAGRTAAAFGFGNSEEIEPSAEIDVEDIMEADFVLWFEATTYSRPRKEVEKKSKKKASSENTQGSQGWKELEIQHVPSDPIEQSTNSVQIRKICA